MSNTTKIALITGGSRGLGKNMALTLAQKGTDVIITYNSKKDEALAVVAEIEAMGRKAAALQLNTGTVSSFPAFFEALSGLLKSTFNAEKIDALVNNAGVGINTTLGKTEEAQFDELVNIHFKGVYFLTQGALPLLANGGRIVLLGTGLTRFSMTGYSVYASLKGAIDTLAKYLAKELGPKGITVNVVAPGAIETDFGGGHVRDNAQVNKYIASITALGRVGQPDDIGGVVAFLCSDDAKWVTGQRIEVSGGTSL